MADTMTPTEVASLIGKSPQFVRVGLQQGRLPFGTAVLVNKRWSYLIIRSKVYEYLGIKED